MSKKSPGKEEIAFRSQIVEDIRPWGKFRSFPYKEAGSIKIITVNPGESLSLQYHQTRSEFWVVLDSGLEITVAEKTWRPERNQEFFIPAKTPHQLRCFGNHPARIMEIWIGKSSENDIIRLKDKYHRTK